MWSVLSFCYTLLVILRKNRVNTPYCWTPSNFDGHDSRGKEKETGARGWAMLLTLCKLRHNFSQEDFAMRFGVHQSTMSRLYSCWMKILEACISEFPLLAGQDFDSGKCASYFQEPLSWHTCHHRFGGDWDWPLSQSDTQSLTWFDYKRRTFKSCIIYPFTSALQPVGLWRCALFWQLWFCL